MEGFLRGRTIGLPNVVLIGAAAVAIWFFFLRGKASVPGVSSQAGTSPRGQATTDYSLGYAQGVQAAGPPPTATTAGGCPNPDTPVNPADWFQSGAGYAYRGGAFYKNCVQYTHVPDTGTFRANQGAGVTQVYFIAPGVPVPIVGTDIPGGGSSSPTWVYQSAPVPTTQGVGGPSPRSRGSRSAAPEWHESHPLIGAPVHYPHYVRAVGGPGRHAAEIHRVAHQAGVHPARVRMLNPQHTGRIRIA